MVSEMVVSKFGIPGSDFCLGSYTEKAHAVPTFLSGVQISYPLLLRILLSATLTTTPPHHFCLNFSKSVSNVRLVRS